MTDIPPASGQPVPGKPEKNHSDRELVNSWVLIPEFVPYVRELRQKYAGVPANADAGIGYVYIDHTHGISMKVECLCIHNDLRLGGDASFLLNNHVSLRFRYSALIELNLIQMTGEEVWRFGMPQVPEWIRFYETPELKTTRDFTWLDQFRAPGFFDDVMAILPGTGGEGPEIVWVRLSRYVPETDRLLCTLLNEPFRNYGIHRNDLLEVQTVRKPDGVTLVVIPGRISPGTNGDPPVPSV